MTKTMLDTSNIKLIIFDFDGVIIDSLKHAHEGNLRAWPDLKVNHYQNFFNGNIYEELEKLPESKYPLAEHLEWFREVHEPKKKYLSIFPKMEEVIRKLAKTYKLTINTSADAMSTSEYLKHHDIDVFTSVYGIEVSKNKIEKFQKILLDFNLSASECVFVTDTVGDVKDASTLNIPTILVSWGYQDESHFLAIKNKVIGIVHKPLDLLDLIS